MSDETIPTWGYSKSGDKIGDVKPGEDLPSGFFDHPSKVVRAAEKSAPEKPAKSAKA